MIAVEEDWEAGSALPRTEPRVVPWEDPELSGWVGFFRTLRDLLFNPGEFFEHLGPGGWAEPLNFALIVSTGGLGLTLFWHLLILAGPVGDTSGPASPLTFSSGALLGLMIASPLLVLADLGVGSLCWWGSVALSGAGRDFTPAWRVFCYAQGVVVLAIIPFLGMLVAAIWTLVLLYIGAKKVLGLSAWGSLGALALFLTLQTILGIIFLLGLIVGVAGLGFLALLG